MIDASIFDPSNRCSAQTPYLTVTRQACVDAVVDEVWTIDPATFPLIVVYDHDPRAKASPGTDEGLEQLAGVGA